MINCISIYVNKIKMPRTQESNIGLIFNDRQAKAVGYNDSPVPQLVTHIPRHNRRNRQALCAGDYGICQDVTEFMVKF
jgi:hypothetical protein